MLEENKSIGTNLVGTNIGFFVGFQFILKCLDYNPLAIAAHKKFINHGDQRKKIKNINKYNNMNLKINEDISRVAECEVLKAGKISESEGFITRISQKKPLSELTISITSHGFQYFENKALYKENTQPESYFKIQQNVNVDITAQLILEQICKGLYWLETSPATKSFIDLRDKLVTALYFPSVVVPPAAAY